MENTIPRKKPAGRGFEINDNLTLKLEHSRTNIYVKGRLFNQCKYLLLDIPTSRIREYDNIGSIDEAADQLKHSRSFGYSHNQTSKIIKKKVYYCFKSVN